MYPCYALYKYYTILCKYYNRKCLAVVYAKLIQKELEEFVYYWNSHRIRHSRKYDCIGGIPDDLYEMPVHYGII